MGEPDDDLAREPARAELGERDTARDAQRARTDQNQYRMLMIQRMDSALEALNTQTKILALMAKSQGVDLSSLRKEKPEEAPPEAPAEEPQPEEPPATPQE